MSDWLFLSPSRFPNFSITNRGIPCFIALCPLVFHTCCFFLQIKMQIPPPTKRVRLTLLQYSLNGGCLESDLQYLRGTCVSMKLVGNRNVSRIGYLHFPKRPSGQPCCILLLRYLSHHRSQWPPPFLAVYHCLHSYYHMALYIQQLDPDCKPLPNPLHPYSLVVMTCTSKIPLSPVSPMNGLIFFVCFCWNLAVSGVISTPL